MKLIPSIALLSACLALQACGNVDLPNEESVSSSKGKRKLSIALRTVKDHPLDYPQLICVFDQAGNKVSQLQVNTSEEIPTFSLAAGSYRIVALTGTKSYNLNNGLEKIDNNISFPQDGTPQQALARGEANVNIGNTASKATIFMSYAVARTKFVLKNLPTSTQSATLQIGSCYQTYSLAGEYANPKPITLPLTRQSDGSWSSLESYVFPTTDNAKLTISLTEDQQTTHYAYSLSRPLLAGTPYEITGNYDGHQNFSLTSEITPASWKDVVSANFNFGQTTVADTTDSSHTADTHTQPSSPSTSIPTYEVATLPQLGEIRNGHFIAYLEQQNDNECEAVLLSLQEWIDVPSANSRTQPTQAADLAKTYREGDLTGWHIPTAEEAIAFSSLYQDEDDRLSANTTLSTQDGKPLTAEVGSTKILYLCENATKTFNLVSSRTASKAGITVLYRLRLFKHVKFIKR